MSNLDDLKRLCSEKKNIVYNLYNKLANATLVRDMQLLTERHTNLNNTELNFYEEKYFEYRINNNILEVIDRRGTSFLWCFEIVLDKNLRIGDSFILNKKIYTISRIDKVDDENILLQIEKSINEYEDTIAFLNNNHDFMQNTYHYECEHEEVKCSDIFEVYKKVNERIL